MVRVLKAFFPAVITAYVLGSLLATQVVLGNLAALGVDVDMATRLDASLHDLLGMASSYLPLILLAFLVAMPAAAGLVRLHAVPGTRVLWFALAGFLALVALHLILRQLLGLWPVAAARGWDGLLLQGLAGASGGGLYSYLSAHSRRWRAPPRGIAQQGRGGR